MDNENLGRKSSKGVSCVPQHEEAPCEMETGRDLVLKYQHKYKLILGAVVCCIYHKPRAIEESSDDDLSSSESDSDSEPDNSKARIGGKGKNKRKGHHHDRKDGDDECLHSPGDNSARQKRSKNAYEKMPKNKVSHQKN